MVPIAVPWDQLFDPSSVIQIPPCTPGGLGGVLLFFELIIKSHGRPESRRYDAEISQHMVEVIEMLTAKTGRLGRVGVRSIGNTPPGPP